jgi:hypothetical protein
MTTFTSRVSPIQMTHSNQSQSEPAQVKLTPFLKFGPFDPDNYKAKELPKAIENEEKYTPVRVLPGQVISGVIKDFYPSTYGELMYLDNVCISSKDGRQDVEKVKVGLSVDLLNKVKVFAKKQPGDEIQIEYLGKHPSPTNPTRTLHKFNVK